MMNTRRDKIGLIDYARADIAGFAMFGTKLSIQERDIALARPTGANKQTT